MRQDGIAKLLTALAWPRSATRHCLKLDRGPRKGALAT